MTRAELLDKMALILRTVAVGGLPAEGVTVKDILAAYDSLPPDDLGRTKICPECNDEPRTHQKVAAAGDEVAMPAGCWLAMVEPASPEVVVCYYKIETGGTWRRVSGEDANATVSDAINDWVRTERQRLETAFPDEESPIATHASILAAEDGGGAVEPVPGFLEMLAGYQDCVLRSISVVAGNGSLSGATAMTLAPLYADLVRKYAKAPPPQAGVRETLDLPELQRRFAKCKTMQEAAEVLVAFDAEREAQGDSHGR